MASSRKTWISCLAFVSPPLVSWWPGAAFASQGPGGGPGTASSFIQLAMAVIVYGTLALVVVGAGLIAALRRLR
jgi:hypothetical protein